MNMLIYCENGNLTIRKSNGLEYTFNNTDKPNFGFEYDVIIYDDIEVKILEWKENVPFDKQEHITLNETEIDAIEQYIENSEPPEGHSLNQQYSNQLCNMTNNYCQEQAQNYGFNDLLEVMIAAREGSCHPFRINARRTLEYYDAVWSVYDNLMQEIINTREDVLREYEHYASAIPTPVRPPQA